LKEKEVYTKKIKELISLNFSQDLTGGISEVTEIAKEYRNYMGKSVKTTF